MRILTITLTVMLTGQVANGLEQGGPSDERAPGRFEQRFRQADADGDGFVDTSEARTARWRVDSDRGRQRFRRTDTDGDGRISLSEAETRRRWELDRRADRDRWTGSRPADDHNMADRARRHHDSARQQHRKAHRAVAKHRGNHVARKAAGGGDGGGGADR